MELSVAGMTCGHCVRAVTQAVEAVAGVQSVAVDLAAGTVRVTGTPDPAAVQGAVTAEGYAVRA